jgi:hypothetical protein
VNNRSRGFTHYGRWIVSQQFDAEFFMAGAGILQHYVR